jgi:hypothetical protein
MSAHPRSLSSANRRAQRRLPPRSGVSVSCHSLKDSSSNLALVLMNVSRDGACVALRRRLPGGERVGLSFAIEGDAACSAQGTIVWTGDYFHELNLAGVRFDAPLRTAEVDQLGNEF